MNNATATNQGKTIKEGLGIEVGSFGVIGFGTLCTSLSLLLAPRF